MHKNRSSERRRLTPRLAVLLLTLAAALLLSSVGVGQAQTSQSLIEVEGGGTQIGFDGERALGFRTAASVGTGYDGWVVTEVELRIRPDDGTGVIRTATPPGLAICEATSSGDPDPNGTCYPLRAPGRVQIPAGMTTGQEVTFRAPGYGHFLATATEYTLHFTENGSTHAMDVHNLDASNNDGEAVSVAGAFANVMRILGSGGVWSGSTSSVAWARITGYASVTPPVKSQGAPPTVLVSNTGQDAASSFTSFISSDLAQAFTTGDIETGYTLSSIELSLTTNNSSNVAPPTVTLYSGSANGTKVADFTGPSALDAFTTKNYAFTPTGTVTLAASIKYFVVVEVAVADSSYGWTHTQSDAEDAVAEPGWSIADVGQSRSRTSTGSFADRANGTAYRLRVNGTIALPALVSNIAQTSGGTSNLAVLDVVQDFTTGENDDGYTLAEIEINLKGTGAGNPPTVTLHSESAIGPKMADFTGPSSLVIGSVINYTYVPTTTVTLSKSTPYYVIIQGGDGLWAYTTSLSEEFAAPGWTIGNRSFTRAADNTGAFFTAVAGPGLLRVKGTVNQPPPGLLVASRTTTVGRAFAAVGNQFDRAQKFTTGINPTGYTLARVEMNVVSSTGGAIPTVTLRSGSATGATVADFSGSSNPLAPGIESDLTYVPVGTVDLSESTDYWVVVEDGANDAQILTITDHGEDPGSAVGWSIEDGSENRSASATGPFSTSTSPLWTKVSGRVNPPSPRSLVSNVGQEEDDQSTLATTNDLAQSFTTGSNRAGYVLNSVDIRFLSTASGVSSDPPTVTLHTGSAAGTAVAVLSRTGAIMAKDNYEFAAAYPVPLTHSTTYWVVAEGGGAGLAWVKTSSTSEDSGGAGGWMIADKGEFRTATSTDVFAEFASSVVLSLRVNGLSNPSRATGPGRINALNAFRVPATLFVTFDGLVDLNGTTMFSDSATYTWKRFAADGTTLEPASIGTDPTYTLTDQDAGKKLRVVVSFIDDDGYPEGPLNSVFTQVIHAAATCAAPTLTGGAMQLGPARKVTVESYGMSQNLLYGFSAAEPAGNLDDATFATADSNNYEIKSIHTTGSSLKVGLNAALTATEKRTLALHVCDQAYAFKSASVSSSTYTFTPPSQNWSGHAERIVYLSQDTAVPTFVSATVNGTSLVMTFSEDLGAAASLANGAFTVKNGMGTTQTLSGTPSISDNKVTLTLATAVGNMDEDVKVAYTKPSTGTANKMVDKFDNEVATFPDQNVINELADSIPPELDATDAAVLAANGVTLTLTFNEALKESSVPAASVFTVKATPAGGSEAEVELASSDGVTVSGSTVVLKLAAPIAHNDGSVKVTYEKPGTGAVIEDANGNDAADFTDRAVTNNSAVPRVSIERVHADASSLIAHAVFRIRRSNMGTEDLDVDLSLTPAGTYIDLTGTTTVIASGQTEKELTVALDYPGNTSGDLTVTVVEGAGYAPALAPNDAATVQVKAPMSGLPLSVRFSQASWTVDEGATVAPTVTFTLAPGLAEPRDRFTVSLETTPEVADSGVDFVAYPAPRARAEPGDWQPASDGGKTQTVAITYETLQDTLVEPNEIFRLRFDRNTDSTEAADIPSTLPDERTTISILDDDPLVVTDVEVS